jgi:hypothetical protein
MMQILTEISISSLALSAAITALATWEAFSDHRWKWVRYRALLSVLYRIKEDMLYRLQKTPPMTVGELDVIYRDLKQAMHETNQEWTGKRSPNITDHTSPARAAIDRP